MGGQDIATYAANTANTANTTNSGGSITIQPTTAVAIKNDSTNPKLLNQKLKVNIKQEYIKGNKNLNLLNINNKAIEDNQLKD